MPDSPDQAAADVSAEAPHDPPMSKQLAAGIREALARVERGQVVDLGSFAQYVDNDRGD